MGHEDDVVRIRSCRRLDRGGIEGSWSNVRSYGCEHDLGIVGKEVE